VSIFEAQKTHTILVVTLMLGWVEVVGHESTIDGEAGIGWEVDAGVAGVAGWVWGSRNEHGFL